jgi:hypothetical protein
MLWIRGSGSIADNGGEGGEECADGGCHVAERSSESGFVRRKLGSGNRVQRVCIQDLTKVRINKEAVRGQKIDTENGFRNGGQDECAEKSPDAKIQCFPD